uniref:Uncharacterized protein n=1 Tax=Globodera rostochiensis TaxID=31243 RepID=A0A914HVL1_GLORO
MNNKNSSISLCSFGDSEGGGGEVRVLRKKRQHKANCRIKTNHSSVANEWMCRAVPLSVYVYNFCTHQNDPSLAPITDRPPPPPNDNANPTNQAKSVVSRLYPKVLKFLTSPNCICQKFVSSERRRNVSWNLESQPATGTGTSSAERIGLNSSNLTELADSQ